MVTYFVNYSFLAETGVIEFDILGEALEERARREALGYIVVIQAVDFLGSVINEM